MSAAYLCRVWLEICFRVCLWVGVLAGCGCDESEDSKKTQATATATSTLSPEKKPSAEYIGSKRCKACHQEAFEGWQASHHQLAMQEPSEQSMLGDFSNARFRYYGQASRFRKKGEKYEVVTEGVYKGASGEQVGRRSFEVEYAFGVEPLQQYLADVGKGHLQTLPFAYDTRPKEAGGQRWYHMYPDEQIKLGDPLHWSAPVQNWNFVCADCHSTNLQKNYDPKTKTYATEYSEISVGCEACHGPGSRHEAQAKAVAGAKPGAGFDQTKGLSRTFSKYNERHWQFAEGKPIAQLVGGSKPGLQTQLSACAKCHARRGDLGGDSLDFHDRYRMELLEDGLYFPDGQIHDEVYVYGSFLQSKMHAAGVVCSDCHEPHSAKLRATGNQLCGRCHSAAVYDSPKHHFHEKAGQGTQCVQCHMPTRTYMGVDERHDHRFGLPRPDLSLQLGVPNPCADCHDKQDEKAAAEWAQVEIEKRFGEQRPATFAHALHAARQIEPAGEKRLLEVINDEQFPPIVRATALLELRAFPHFDASRLSSQFEDPHPLVRRALAQLAGNWPPEQRQRVLRKLLNDEVRSVRLEAVRGLLDVARSSWSKPDQLTFFRVREELKESLKYNADRPGALLDLARLELLASPSASNQRSKPNARAEMLFRQALELDASFTGAYVNFADYYRSLGRDAEAEVLLKTGLDKAADPAQLHHALGLTLVRLKRPKLALEHLKMAHELRPELPRLGFVYAVALWEQGKQKRAIEVLEKVHQRFEGELRVLRTLAQYYQLAGNQERAQELRAKWQQGAAR